jgi:hypothetical protein
LRALTVHTVNFVRIESTDVTAVCEIIIVFTISPVFIAVLALVALGRAPYGQLRAEAGRNEGAHRHRARLCRWTMSRSSRNVNSLNTLANLIVTNPNRAEIMTLRLAKVFRHVLKALLSVPSSHSRRN